MKWFPDSGGNDKTGCHSPGKLRKLCCLWEGLWSVCYTSQIQKVGDPYVVSYRTFWKSTPYWKMWENHRNTQNRSKMAWHLFFFVVHFKQVNFFIIITWMQSTSVCGGFFSLKPQVFFKPYIKSIWTSRVLRTTVKSWELSHSQTAYEKLSGLLSPLLALEWQLGQKKLRGGVHHPLALSAGPSISLCLRKISQILEKYQNKFPKALSISSNCNP